MQLNGLYYHLRTFGCQMNQHDSERIAGMLEALGALPVSDAEQADIVVFMTCCVREAADTRLYGQVASLKNLPAPNGRRLIAIGGCIGQRDGELLIERLPHVDVVFGTHNLASLPGLLIAALNDAETQVEVLSDSEAATLPKATSLPIRRQQAWQAWVPIMTGCDNFCSYCIVPYVRGRETSRPFEEVLHEVDKLLAEGVVEITLLGQNVNSYGRDLYGQPRFAEMLRAVGNSGIQRLRFTTSHPKDLSEQTIAAFAETAAVMPQLHLPFQSGSDRILKAMNRNYTADHYRGLIQSVRQATAAAGKGLSQQHAASQALGKQQVVAGGTSQQQAAGQGISREQSADRGLEKQRDTSKSLDREQSAVAFSTDIIVGFPGETEADFQATCDLVSEIGFSQAFTFIYSRREGTPAAELVDDTPAEVIQERFQRLVQIVQQSAWQQNQLELDKTTSVLFEGTSKRDQSMLSGRNPQNTTVHVPLPVGRSLDDYIGRIEPVHIDLARTWYLRGELA